jgi:hypothetical protein
MHDRRQRQMCIRDSNSSNRRIDVQIHHQINIKRQKQQQGSWGLAASSEDEDGSDDE